MSFKIKFTCIINVLYKETYETKQQKKSAHANTKSLSKSSQLNCSYMTHVSVITACFSLRTAHISQPYTNKSNISLDVCVCVCVRLTLSGTLVFLVSGIHPYEQSLFHEFLRFSPLKFPVEQQIQLNTSDPLEMT